MTIEAARTTDFSTWNQTPYLEERETELRATMIRMAEHSVAIWSACVDAGAQMIYNG